MIFTAGKDFVLDCRGIRLNCSPFSECGPIVMGILNITPDSFSDGGLYLDVDAALRRADQIMREGGRIIDIGGESTRPSGRTYGSGATPVSADEELQRVIPVIEAVRANLPEAIISIDTYKPAVARAAIEAGASIINDITGLRYDTGLAEVAAEFSTPLVLMHSRGRPGEMPHSVASGKVVEDVVAGLRKSLTRASEAGVRQTVVDPGFGFGKTVEGNLKLVANLNTFLQFGRPVMIGISRKSTIGTILGTLEHPVPSEARLSGSLAATAVAVLKGASIVRTHDVRPTVETLQVINALTMHMDDGEERT